MPDKETLMSKTVVAKAALNALPKTIRSASHILSILLSRDAFNVTNHPYVDGPANGPGKSNQGFQ
jgi:hypothetical protein